MKSRHDDEHPWNLPEITLAEIEGFDATSHFDFDVAFVDGTRARVGGETVRIETVRAGELVLPSGRVIVGDPAHLEFEEHRQPLQQQVATGRYPVTIAFAAWEKHRRPAFLKVDVGEAPVSFWMPAPAAGGQSDEIQFSGGVVCLADVEPVEAILARSGVDWFADYYLRRVMDTKLERDEEWGAFHLDEASGANLWVCHPGEDTAFPPYWGLDGAGEPVLLVLDLQLLTESICAKLVFEDVFGDSSFPLEDERLDALNVDVSVRVHRRGVELACNIPDPPDCRIIARDGTCLVGEQSDVTIRSRRVGASARYPCNTRQLDGARLELVFYLGECPIQVAE